MTGIGETNSPSAAPQEVVFGRSAGAECLELVRQPEAEGIPPQNIKHPFVTIDDTGLYSRILLARVLTDAGRIVPVAVKVQKDILSLPPAGFGRRYSNSAAAAAFQEEAACLRRLDGDREGIVLPVRGASVGPGALSRQPLRSLPITYCKKTAVFFHPVCPDCGEFLCDCRDEVLLGGVGLPPYATSTQRFLFCPKCGGGSHTARTFYAVVAGPSVQYTADIRLRIGGQLYRDYQRLVRPPDRSPTSTDDYSPGVSQFPCVSCPHKEACYPVRSDESRPIPAEQLLYPVAYYEFLAIVREFCEMDFGQLYRYLGGQSRAGIKLQPAAQVVAGLSSDKTGREQPRETPDGWYFFGNAAGERSAAEILWLKLAAFEQLCEGVWQVYEKCGRPHLDLRPQSILAVSGKSSRWSFGVGLANPAAAIPAQTGRGEQEGGSRSYLPRSDFRRLFTSPVIRRPPFGHEEYANVTIRRVEQHENGVIVEGHLVSEVIGVFRLMPQDQLKITLNIPANKADGLVLWASGAEPVRGGYRVTARASRVRPDIRQALEGQIEHTLWDCRVNICRFYHAPCDLYSLGMILWCMLLVNDQQEEAEVCRYVEDVGRKLTALADSHDRPPAELERKLRELLAENREVFGPQAVFYRAADRTAGAPDISDELWFACQKLGLAMITEIAGFSLSREVSESGPSSGSALIKNALERLKDLNLWAEGRLFAKGAFSREFRATTDQEKADVTGGVSKNTSPRRE